MIIRLSLIICSLFLFSSCGLLRDEPKGPKTSSSTNPWSRAQPGDGAAGPLTQLSQMNRR